LCNGRQIAFIEDAAQAVGASLDGLAAGSFGTGCFSFYATKNLTTGEGGMLTTNDAAIASRARMLRSQGEHERYVTEEVGWNYRLTEPAAALGSIQLLTLDERNSQRRANALKLSEMLAGLVDIVTPQETPTKGHAWHQYVIRILAGRDVRDALQVALRAHGIESAAFYPRAIHKQPLYARLGHGESNAPIAERLSGEVLALPVHPGLTPTDLGAIADAVRAFFAESANDTTTDRR
jgi:perosamine synthetase